METNKVGQASSGQSGGLNIPNKRANVYKIYYEIQRYEVLSAL